ncbi:MAG: NrfD/PsrC family molybdoenzyme membrane anchor subunit [Candidatus Omnitrophota bacterium]|nr:NrfD/PsrC family molybdoenzyme membrane anchor subunit [Candidatus Omnitrophota bacterium]
MSQISLSPFANFSSAVPWGLWVGIYIWLVGISAGSFLFVCWGSLTNNLLLKKITKLGILLSLSTLLAGLLSIQIDLGRIERFYKLFTSPSLISVMAWMVWLYAVYFAILLVSLREFKKEIPKKSFSCFVFLFALAILVVESLLFARPPGKHWHSPIFLLHFLTSSLVSAIATIMFIAGILCAKDKKTNLLSGLSNIALPLIIINFGIELVDILFLGGISHLGNLILLLCNIIIILLFVKKTPISITLGAVMASLVILFSKYVGLISAQIVEPFRGFAMAYIEPRLQFSYTPTVFEFLVGIFLMGLAASLFYILYRVFPLTREE